MLITLYIIQFIITSFLILFIFLQKREEATNLLSTNVYNSMFKNIAVPHNPLVTITFIFGVLFFINSILVGIFLIKSSKSSNNNIIQKIQQYSDNPKNFESVKKSNGINNKSGMSKKNKSKLSVVPLGN